MDLPRPGVIGIAIRLALGALVLWMGYGAVVDVPSFWDGFDDPLGSLAYVIPLAALSSWVLTELVQRPWGWWPTVALLAALLAAVVVGAFAGDPFGPLYGVALWTWIIAFSALLGPAHILAAVLRTPGCEMRSYAHLASILRGDDWSVSVCPGWIDQFDGVRLRRR